MGLTAGSGLSQSHGALTFVRNCHRAGCNRTTSIPQSWVSDFVGGGCGGNDHHVYFGRVHSVSTLIFLHIFSMDVHFKFLVGLKTFLNSIMYIQSGFKLVFNYRFYNVTPQMPSMAHASS